MNSKELENAIKILGNPHIGCNDSVIETAGTEVIEAINRGEIPRTPLKEGVEIDGQVVKVVYPKSTVIETKRGSVVIFETNSS